MIITSVKSVLLTKYPAELVDALLNAYGEIEKNFTLRKWKASELDSGHFVEAARRILEQVLFGHYSPLTSSLPKFTDQVLSRYENATGDESVRILIPRALKSIYNIRNKRGVGHLSGVQPNEMDSTYILYSTKWILAEFVRLASGLPPDETQKMIEKIVERRVEILWKEDDIVRILDTALNAKEQVLILLYDHSPQLEEELRSTIEYRNVSQFRKLLLELHKKKMIFRRDDGQCLITSKGLIEAEKILHGK